MKRQLYAVGALCLSLIAPVSSHAASSKIDVVVGGGPGVINEAAAALVINGPVQISGAITGAESLAGGSIGSMGILVQSTPSLKTVMFDSFGFIGGDKAGNGTIGKITPKECNPGCIVSITSQDLIWGIKFTPIKNIKLFIPHS